MSEACFCATGGHLIGDVKGAERQIVSDDFKVSDVERFVGIFAGYLFASETKFLT